MDLSFLNEMQQKAVLTTEGPVLVLAGAGSGKTSVLTNRVAYLIQEKNVSPYNILAITFTNKAAAEMRERIGALVSINTNQMIVSTFHSMCARFLRMDAANIGYQPGFTIYDSSDSLSVIKKILADKQVDIHYLTPKKVQNIISSAKNAAGRIPPAEFFESAYGNFVEEIKSIFKAYEARLKAENAMDFDDLLLNTLKLLKENEQARNYYTNRFHYIMVDEYQDTNAVQYELVRILSGKYGNIFAVGDDDQSVYAWRGADIRNILEFERDYKNAVVIKLEQNYRSHGGILETANAVISNNMSRKPKELWSARPRGDKPYLFTAPNEYQEAEFIAMQINEMVKQGKTYSDFAILYRMHTQSRVLEEKLRLYGIPYNVYGGTSFYARKEIKDMIAYLTLLVNEMADTALMRIINVPRRGIGDVTVSKITEIAQDLQIPMMHIIRDARTHFGKAVFVNKLEKFYEDYMAIKEAVENRNSSDILLEVFERSGYKEMLSIENDGEAQMRYENIEELVNAARDYESGTQDGSLTGFLENVALINDIDTMSDNGTVTMMTLHSAKGLEFDTVFMVGMEESLFPSARALDEGNLEEERRLCYVGITRAKNTLYFTNCEKRTLFNSMNRNPESRFLGEIPEDLLQMISLQRPRVEYVEPVKQMEMPLFENKKEFHSKAIEPMGDFIPGVHVEHPKFGAGVITDILGDGKEKIALVDFKDGGQRKMFLAFAPLKIKD